MSLTHSRNAELPYAAGGRLSHGLAGALLGGLLTAVLLALRREGPQRCQAPAAQPAAENRAPWQRVDAKRWLPLLPKDQRDWVDTRSPDLDGRLYDGEYAVKRGTLFDGLKAEDKLALLGCKPAYNEEAWIKSGKSNRLNIAYAGCREKYLERIGRRKARLPLLLANNRTYRQVEKQARRRVYIDLGGNTIHSFHYMLTKDYPQLRQLCFGSIVFEPGENFRAQWAEAEERQRALSRQELCRMPWEAVGKRPNETAHKHMRSWAGLPLEFFPAAAWVANETLAFSHGISGNAGTVRSAKGVRNLSPNYSAHRRSLPYAVQGVDLADFILRRYRPEDFVVLKIDVEGAEHRLVPHLIRTGAVGLVDELFLECHCREVWNVEPWSFAECYHLMMTLLEAGVYVHEWF
eukprot:TRINITY_DN28929_c0_g1_i1.p1 TRINITY_DN28929_c0_g1~~TRINITY_DN28929_c0_g1_i1.p1  ORF type:complete len:435 (+),score=90.39 TRINITY_DN28929_c0_g1_i1:92-1306(+)